jgi:transmembrane sensor
MSHDAKSRDEIAATAAGWLVRLDAGSADPADFDAWRNSDPRHASVFAQMAATWKQSGDLRWAAATEEPVAPPDPTPDSTAVEEAATAWPGMNRRAAITGLAAGVAAMVAGTSYWMQTRRDFATTGIGERRILRLPGGALANLNTGTEIAWRIGDTLEVWVEKGEVALQLAGEGASRAVLHAATIRAELTGGAYNLRLFNQGPRLAVMAGTAIVSGTNGFAETLRANEVLIGDASGYAKAPLSSEERAQADAWQRGEIIFDGMELADALDEFNRYLSEPIRLADPAIGAIRLGGRFRTEDPSGFLQSLNDGFGIESRRGDSSILLYQQ